MIITLLLLGAGYASAVTVMAIANRGHPLLGVIWFGINAAGCTAAAAWSLMTGGWLSAVWMTVCALINAWMAWNYWNRRKRRKRAPRAFGAKSRARLAALVRKAREAATPRKVLRPVPGGARWGDGRVVSAP